MEKDSIIWFEWIEGWLGLRGRGLFLYEASGLGLGFDKDYGYGLGICYGTGGDAYSVLVKQGIGRDVLNDRC